MSERQLYPHRRTLRLPDYDYAQPGMYFVTICTHKKRCLFGEIVGIRMLLSKTGAAVEEEFLRSFDIRQELGLDAWVLMPNHLHAVVMISEPKGYGRMAGDLPVAPTIPLLDDKSSEGGSAGRPKPERSKGPPCKSLSSFVGGFKAAATNSVRKMVPELRGPVWQRGYYEHVIRSEEELERIRVYIAGNPQMWPDDEENPVNRTRQLKRHKPWQ